MHSNFFAVLGQNSLQRVKNKGEQLRNLESNGEYESISVESKLLLTEGLSFLNSQGIIQDLNLASVQCGEFYKVQKPSE